MAQQYPPNGGRGGGRGPHSGGRSGGRGGGVPPQQLQQNYNYTAPGVAGGRGSGNMGAWQPAQPTSLQQAAGYPGLPQQVAGGGRGGYVQPHPPPAYYPYTTGPNPYGPQHVAPPHNRQWQGYGAPPQVGMPTQSNMAGGVFYPQHAGRGIPPPAAMANTPAVPAPPPPREKKPLLITDKEGNVIDFSSAKKPVSSSLQSAATTVAPKAPTIDAGTSLREAALEHIKAKENEKKAMEGKSQVENTQKDTATDTNANAA
jgi:hypothetical protein